jgi:type I restriction-modification system DNA methylase subunit
VTPAEPADLPPCWLHRRLVLLAVAGTVAGCAALSGGDARLDRQIERAARLANSPVSLLITGETGSGKELVKRLTDLIAIVETPALNFARNRADVGDILGDAYEYLMRHFAVESGKSKGQFLTPAELGRPVTPYGQEKDAASSGLARMTMILPSNTTAIIWQGNTLANPQLKEGEQFKQFDSLVVNPPFSDKRWSTGLDAAKDPHSRFEGFGIPPAKQGIVLRIVDAFTRQLELSA